MLKMKNYMHLNISDRDTQPRLVWHYISPHPAPRFGSVVIDFSFSFLWARTWWRCTSVRSHSLCMYNICVCTQYIYLYIYLYMYCSYATQRCMHNRQQSNRRNETWTCGVTPRYFARFSCVVVAGEGGVGFCAVCWKQ